MPFLTNENMLYYQSAYRIDMLDLIDMVAIIQGHIDQGISTTLFVTDDKTTRQDEEGCIVFSFDFGSDL